MATGQNEKDWYDLTPGPLWVIWLPLLVLPVIWLCRAIAPEFTAVWIMSEQGFVENIVALMAFAFLPLAWGIWTLRHELPSGLLGFGFLLLGFGGIYWGGEEISWGQNWFGWETPDSISEINDQNETNLHNTSSWLDQKPRNILLLHVVIGGIIAPLVVKFRGISLDPQKWWYWGFTPISLTVLAVLTMFIGQIWDGFFDNVVGAPAPFPLDVRTSEIQEFFLAWFLLAFLWTVRARLRVKSGVKTPH